MTALLPTPPSPRAIIARGRATAQVEMRDLADRFVASDPGLTRFRQGLRAVIAVATTAGVEYLSVKVLGLPPAAASLHIMLGAVIAMNMALTIKDNRRHVILGTALLAPVAAAFGAVTATLVVSVHWLSLTLFVAVTFIAVWVRRFGPRGNSLGFVAWQAYFFAQFLRPPVSQLPSVLLAIITSTTWVTLLLLTVLYDDARAGLRRTVTALRARARSVVSAALDVLAEPGDARVQRVLRRRLIHLTEGALLFDARLADPRALPHGVVAPPLRRWVVELEIGIDEVANATVDLAEMVREGRLDSGVERDVRRTLQTLGWSDLDAAREQVARLRRPPADRISATRRLANATEAVLRLVDDWQTGRVAERARHASGDIEPAVSLVGGNLPGTGALVEDIYHDEDAAWWSPARLRLSTRQAVQATVAAALAITLGELISPQRFYWAVIAAFVCFIGTSTAGETMRRGFARISGTLGGLVVAVLLGAVTAGHSTLGLVLLLLSIFCAFYLQALSQTAMVFFITLMLGQLYGLLNRFSDQVLVLRLEETAVGALVGTFTALLVLPASTQRTLIHARRELLGDLADLMDSCSARLRGEDVGSDALLGRAMEMEAIGRQVSRTHQSMPRPRFLDNDGPVRAHRVAVLAVSAATARSLVPPVLAVSKEATYPTVAAAVDAVAEEARRLAAVPHLRDQHPRPPDEPAISEKVSRLLDESDAPVQLIRRTQRVADSLGLLTPRGRHL